MLAWCLDQWHQSYRVITAEYVGSTPARQGARYVVCCARGMMHIVPGECMSEACLGATGIGHFDADTVTVRVLPVSFCSLQCGTFGGMSREVTMHGGAGSVLMQCNAGHGCKSWCNYASSAVT